MSAETAGLIYLHAWLSRQRKDAVAKAKLRRAQGAHVDACAWEHHVAQLAHLCVTLWHFDLAGRLRLGVPDPEAMALEQRAVPWLTETPVVDLDRFAEEVV